MNPFTILQNLNYKTIKILSFESKLCKINNLTKVKGSMVFCQSFSVMFSRDYDSESIQI